MVIEYAPVKTTAPIPKDESHLGTLSVASESDLEQLNLHTHDGKWRASIGDRLTDVQLTSMNFAFIALFSRDSKLHGVILPTDYVSPRLEQHQALKKTWPRGERRTFR